MTTLIQGGIPGWVRPSKGLRQPGRVAQEAFDAMLRRAAWRPSGASVERLQAVLVDGESVAAVAKRQGVTHQAVYHTIARFEYRAALTEGQQ